MFQTNDSSNYEGFSEHMDQTCGVQYLQQG